MKLNLKTKYKKLSSTYDGYCRGLVELGKRNEKIIVLSPDFKSLAVCAEFAEEFPERFIQDKVTSQNMVGLAAGMAIQGYIPFISSSAVFSLGSNWEQIRTSICYPNLNVKIISFNTGLSDGSGGATFQALEDIALARVLPNMRVISPLNAQEAEKAIIASAEINGPVYIRFTKNEPSIFSKDTKFEIGKAGTLVKGNDVTIVGSGMILNEVLKAAKELKSKYKIRAEIINCHTIKPIDSKTIILSAKKTGAVVCCEEHQICGGLGSAVAEILSEYYPVPIRFIGMPDSFGESGEPNELTEKYGMTKEKIIQASLNVINKSNKSLK